MKGKPVQTTLPSASGKGQVFWRCADCGVTVWSNYAGAGPNIHFVRVGTLDDPAHEQRGRAVVLLDAVEVRVTVQVEVQPQRLALVVVAVLAAPTRKARR